MSNGNTAESLSNIILSRLKFVRALLVFLLFFLALQEAKNWVPLVWEGQRGTLDASIGEPKLRCRGFLLFVDRPVHRPPEAADIEDPLFGGARAIVVGAPATAATSGFEKLANSGTPILLYSQAPDSRVGVFIGLDGRNAGEYIGDATMADDDPGDRDSF